LVGTPAEGVRAVLMALAWIINFVVAEYVIRRRPGPGRVRSPQRARSCSVQPIERLSHQS
jgi:hypothetical protein